MIGMNAKFLREAKLEEELGNSLVVKEPIGVVGCVTPWNYPLHQVVCKIAPALAAGCTIVLKPAEMAPLSAFMLADAAHEIGLPAGVLNVVSGSGRVVGEAIVAHPDVDMVSFTGSLQAGRRIASRRRRGHQEGLPRARRQVGVRRPGRCAVRQGDSGRREQLHAELRADVLGVDAHAGAARAARRSGRAGEGAARQADARRSVRQEHAARSAGVGGAARQRARLHRAGQERRRDAGRRRRPARAVRRRASTSSRRSSPTSTTA